MSESDRWVLMAGLWQSDRLAVRVGQGPAGTQDSPGAKITENSILRLLPHTGAPDMSESVYVYLEIMR